MILKTTNLELTYENGLIRRIVSRNQEIIRMIYPAVRDENWSTIIPKIKDEIIKSNEHSFTVAYKAIYFENNIHFEADFKIEGNKNSIVFDMRGVARSNFLKNRIGLCVHHPIKECIGETFDLETWEGKKVKLMFPEYISPHQPAKNIRKLNWNIDGLKVNLCFEGDVFEMEDQRNWTDASYKTYSTPLEFPFPLEIGKGETINQKITLKVSGETQGLHKFNYPCIELSDGIVPFPNLGFSHSTATSVMPQHIIKHLEQISPGHYRGDIYFNNEKWKEKCSTFNEESNKLGAKLFFALHFGSNYKQELEEFERYIIANEISPSYLLFLQEKSRFSSSGLIEEAKDFRIKYPGIKIGGGVDANFAELNRSNLDTSNLDFVSFTITPQIHAFDDMSLIENLEGQKYAIESAKKICPGKSIFVSPVTLKPRFNVVATNEDKASDIPETDIRQSTFFNALWTLISIKYLAESGTELVTFFETHGERGIIKDNPFPVYYIFELLKEAKYIIPSTSSSPLTVDSICIKTDKDIILFIANFRSEIQKIQLPVSFSKAKYFIKDSDSCNFNENSSSVKSRITSLPPFSITILFN